MAKDGPAVQIGEVARLERELGEARSRAAASLRETRQAIGISLRQTANGVRLSPGALSNLECARSWQTKTALRVATYLSRVA